MADIRTIQLWPRGTSVSFSGDPHGPDVMIHKDYKDETGRPATADEKKAIKIEVLAGLYSDREILHCDSALVTDAMKHAYDSRNEFFKEFEVDNITNMRPDPADWDVAKCHEFLDDNGHDKPRDNLYEYSRVQLIEALHPEWVSDEEPEPAEVAGLSDDDLKEKVAEDADPDEWRDAVREHAEDAEVYEWWRVTKWLAEKLTENGDVVLDNAYGYWWGRTCTGQGYIMDGTLQEIAAKFA